MLSFARRLRHSPFKRSRAEQHFTGGGACLAHGIPGRAHASAAASRLISIKRAGSCLLDRDLVQVGLKFLRKDHGQRSVYTLPHFRSRDHNSNLPVRRDLQICVRREWVTAPVCGFVRKIEADNQTSSYGRSRSEKFSSRERTHRPPPALAAR